MVMHKMGGLELGLRGLRARKKAVFHQLEEAKERERGEKREADSSPPWHDSCERREVFRTAHR